MFGWLRFILFNDHFLFADWGSGCKGLGFEVMCALERFKV